MNITTKLSKGNSTPKRTHLKHLLLLQRVILLQYFIGNAPHEHLQKIGVKTLLKTRKHYNLNLQVKRSW